MRKKGICFGLILALLLPFVFTTEVKASDNTELNIYAFYLNSEKKGDSTLLESKGHYLLIDIGADNHAPAIIKQLQTLGVTHVDVMFSHLHTDHTGGCSTDLQSRTSWPNTLTLPFLTFYGFTGWIEAVCTFRDYD